MSTVRKTITVTDQQNDWVKTRISNGHYTNDSEYFRDLLRRDQQRNERLTVLREAIAEGFDSGSSNRSVEDIWTDAETTHG